MLCQKWTKRKIGKLYKLRGFALFSIKHLLYLSVLPGLFSSPYDTNKLLNYQSKQICLFSSTVNGMFSDDLSTKMVFHKLCVIYVLTKLLSLHTNRMEAEELS